MTTNPYILFNKSLEERRRLGARGGRAQACNRRLRGMALAVQPVTRTTATAPEPETAAAAIAALDAQFPWLRGVEKRGRADERLPGLKGRVALDAQLVERRKRGAAHHRPPPPPD